MPRIDPYLLPIGLAVLMLMVARVAGRQAPTVGSGSVSILINRLAYVLIVTATVGLIWHPHNDIIAGIMLLGLVTTAKGRVLVPASATPDESDVVADVPQPEPGLDPRVMVVYANEGIVGRFNDLPSEVVLNLDYLSGSYEEYRQAHLRSPNAFPLPLTMARWVAFTGPSVRPTEAYV